MVRFHVVLGSFALVLSALVAPVSREIPMVSRGERPTPPSHGLPFMFEADARGGFAARTAGYRVRITNDGADIVLRGGAANGVALRFPGSAKTHPLAEAPLDVRVNHLLGAREDWRVNQGAYARVRLPQLYPGVDAVFYGSDRELEYDLIVAPGQSPTVIALAFPGSAVRASADGLQVEAGGRTLVQRQAKAYQDRAGRRVEVPVRYHVEDGRVGFDVGAYDATQPLVIDPLLSYSTYVGATGVDRANGVAADAQGNAYVVGTTEWDDFAGPVLRPHTPRRGASSGDDRDAYIAKFRPDGSMAWISFVGGTSWDTGNAIAVGPDGDVYVGGDTHSADFPSTAGAFHTAAPASGEDAFLLRLAADGTTLRYSTLLGAEQPRSNGHLAAVAVDGLGRAYIVGTTGSNTFPATVWDSRSPAALTIDNTDAFVARFSSDGARLDWARLFGGSHEDGASALTIDQYGAAYVVGSTCSTDFTVLNALYPAHFGPSGSEEDCSPDGFLTYVWTDGSLGFSTYLGGAGHDWMTAVGQGLYGRVFVGGTTTSAPANGEYKPSSGQSGVIYQIAPNGSAIFNTRYVGGSGDSQLNALVFTNDPSWFWILGTTDGNGWPYGYTGYPDPPAQGHPGGGPDFFLQKWDARNLDTLYYSDTFGGGGPDNATSIARNRIGDIYITGYTRSANFPLKNASQSSIKPAAPDATSPLQQDGVIARFNCHVSEIEPVAKQPAAGGGGRTRTYVEEGCLGEPVSDAAWLHVGAYEPYGVSFTVDANPTSAERTAHITTSGRSTATVVQAADPSAPPPPPPTATDEVVINARDARRVTGTWQSVPDDVHGAVVRQPDAGQAKIGTASASPANYVEFTFTADAGKPYHLWIHGRAQDDSWQNDSVYVQFSDSVDASGAPANRIGTTSAAWVSLEECSGCGEQGWGWQDNAYGGRGDLGPDIYFASSGPHTLRLQQREDGFAIGQIVLSAKAYLRTAPGGNRNDPTIVPTAAPPPPAARHNEIVLWTAADTSAMAGTWSVRSDASAAGSASIGNPDQGAPKLASPQASPASYIDVSFTADAGTAYHLWLRLKADGDAWTNDSVWVQFSGAVDASGNPIFRTGTTSGTWVSLEECSGCGEQGWGWQDNAYGAPGDLGPDVYFAASGPQTIRIQVREDGLAIDQIVLSAVRYKSAAPGSARNDATVLPRTPPPSS